MWAIPNYSYCTHICIYIYYILQRLKKMLDHSWDNLKNFLHFSTIMYLLILRWSRRRFGTSCSHARLAPPRNWCSSTHHPTHVRYSEAIWVPNPCTPGPCLAGSRAPLRIQQSQSFEGDLRSSLCRAQCHTTPHNQRTQSHSAHGAHGAHGSSQFMEP